MMSVFGVLDFFFFLDLSMSLWFCCLFYSELSSRCLFIVGCYYVDYNGGGGGGVLD